jgi:hypothetical protein
VKLRVIAICCLLFCWIPVSTFAEESTVPLEIEPIYPDNQRKDTKGYFDLLVQPGQQQTVELSVTNNLEEEITLSGSTANAYTHPSGGMLYGQGIDSESTRLLEDAVHLVDYIKIKDTITIPAQSTVNVSIEILVPEEEGTTFLGGVLLTTQPMSIETQESTEKDTANVILNTETTYTVAVQLNLSNEETPDFSLGNAGFINETGEIFIEMSNNAHLIQEEILGTYSVTDQEGSELFSGEIPTFKMAPKSQIRYSIPWGNDRIEDGEYTLTVNGSAGGSEFTSTETFSIENKDVQEYADKNLPKANTSGGQGIPVWVWITGAIVFGFFMFMIGIKLNKRK